MDLLFLAGLTAVAAGVALLSVPAALIVVGTAFCGVSLRAAAVVAAERQSPKPDPEGEG